VPLGNNCNWIHLTNPTLRGGIFRGIQIWDVVRVRHDAALPGGLEAIRCPGYRTQGVLERVRLYGGSMEGSGKLFTNADSEGSKEGGYSRIH